jgi:hypothetical protein
MVVYLEPSQVLDPPPPYRTGAAGRAWIDENGEIESESRVALCANSTHALLGHGVVDRLNALEIEGRLGRGREVMIPPAKCDAALQIFYQADSMTYGESFDFLVAQRESEGGEDVTQFRIRIDNREYQRALSRLQFLISSASREGSLVWIRI